MKKSFLKWAGLVFLAVCVASCEKQSEMSLENIAAPGSSVSVSGYVEIAEEWEWDTYAAVLKEPVAAEGISVILEIPNSSFNSGSKGNQVFTTTTDEYGMYNFDVKINPTSSTSAKIIIPQFEKQGTYYEVTTDKDTKKQGTLVFEVVTRNISLSSNQDYLVPKITLEPTVPQL